MTTLWIRSLRTAQRVGALASLTLLLSCASLSQKSPWYEGAFESELFGGTGFKFACDGALTCEAYTTSKSSAPKASDRLANGIAKPFSTTIPNNNLKGTQRFVAAHEGWEQLPGDDGALLRASRSIVASSAVFSECIALDTKWSSSLLLCASNGDPIAREVVYLLSPSMAPSCRESSPYCAYIYIPLRRMR